MTTKPSGSDIQKVVLWFLDLPYIDSVYKLEIIEYMKETDEISVEVLVYMNHILEENASLEAQKLKELEHVKELLDNLSAAEKAEATSMKVSVVKEAERFLQEVSGDFKTDFSSYKKRKDQEAESVEHSTDEKQAQSLRDKLTN